MRRLLFLLLLSAIKCLSMDAPLVPCNPADGCMIIDIIKKNNVVALNGILAQYGCRSFTEGLHTAAAYGRVGCMRIFLTYGADINGTTAQGDTPLHYAKTVKVADFLLMKNAIIDQKNKRGKTPLYKALFCHGKERSKGSYKRQGLAIAQLLVHNDADINSLDEYGDSLLHTAIRKRDVAAAEFLLRNDINAYKTDSKDMTAFDVVVQGCHGEFFPLFEKYGMIFFPRMKISHLLHHQLSTKLTQENIFDPQNCINIDRMGRLFVSANNYDELPRSFKEGLFFNGLGCIVNNVSPEHLQELLGPEVFKNFNSILRFLRKKMESAAREKNILFLKDLLEHFPWLAHHNLKLTHWMMRKAIEEKYNACLAALLTAKTDLPEYCLHTAVFYDNPQALSLLVKHGADCLEHNSQKLTPLKYAVQLGHTKCAEILNTLSCQLCRDAYKQGDYTKSMQYINCMTDVNKPFGKEKDVLMHAILAEGRVKRSIEFIPLLLAKGAQVNCYNGKGKIPLYYVSVSCNRTFPIFKMLLNAGADINQEESLLFTALLKRCEEKLQLFLEHRAIVKKVMLESYQSHHIMALLERHYHEQACCICLEHTDDVSPIGCKNKHRDFLCKQCSATITVCPLCRGCLRTFNS